VAAWRGGVPTAKTTHPHVAVVNISKAAPLTVAKPREMQFTDALINSIDRYGQGNCGSNLTDQTLIWQSAAGSKMPNVCYDSTHTVCTNKTLSLTSDLVSVSAKAPSRFTARCVQSAVLL